MEIQNSIKDHYAELYQSNQELIEKSASLLSDVDNEHLQNLKDHFGYSSFRPLQWTIINAVMHEKKDVCAALAPGYGRSLCYQYPAICTKGTVLVISPLIQKIEEEVRSMTISGVSTLFLDSCWYNCAKSSVDQTLKGNYSIIYLNSEFFPSYEKSPLKLLNLKLIVIDEAHCVSEWGHDFRVVYKEVQTLRKIFPNTPLLALTSSPSPPVRNDIITHFQMRDPLVVCSNFDRANLKFEVQLSTETSVKTLLKVLHTNPADWKTLFNECTVIYVESRAMASVVQKKLQENSIPSLEYHSGVVQIKQNCAVEQFMHDETKVLITTVSHGLSIHKPDIRNIIHMFCPKDIENYYQEIGIAGRDGLPTRCILFCVPIFSDLPSYIQDVMAQTEQEINHRKTLLIKLMGIFLTTKACRSQFLRRFNGVTLSATDFVPDYCDNCEYELLKNDRYHYCDLGLDVFGKCDVGSDYVEYLETLQKIDSKCSVDAVAALLASESVLNTTLVHTSSRWWQGIGHLLAAGGYIENYFLQKLEVNCSSVIKPQGKTLLSQKPAAGKIMETPNHLMYKELLYRKTTAKITPSRKMGTLQLRLLQKRLELAKLCGCACFTIASNNVIKTISMAKPRSFVTLQKLDLPGFNKRRLECFGREFVRVSLENLVDSWFVVCSMIRAGVDTLEAKKKRLSDQTLFEFIATGIRNGFVFDWSHLGITDEMKRKVSDVITKHEDMFLSTTPDWSSSEDLKRFAALDVETGKILAIWTHLHQFHQLKLEFPRDGSMISMAETLFKNPLSVNIPNCDWILLSLLGTSPTEIQRIARIKCLPARKIWDSIATGIMKGHNIKLANFGVNTSEFLEEIATKMLAKKEFRAGPNFARAGEFFKRADLSSLSSKPSFGQVLLIWAYLSVRIHLYSLNVNFYDFDPPSEKLKQILLEESVSNESKKIENTLSSKRRKRSRKSTKQAENVETIDEVEEVLSAHAPESQEESIFKNRENSFNAPDEKTKDSKSDGDVCMDDLMKLEVEEMH